MHFARPWPLLLCALTLLATADRAFAQQAVSATKSVSGTFLEGGTVTYTVVLTNNLAHTLLDNPGNEFTDVLPSTLTLVSASATSGTTVATGATNTVTWNGSIASGGSVTITITATINAGTAGSTVSNQGTWSFDADNNGTNESSTVTDDPSTPAAGDATTFTVADVAPTLPAVALMALALLLAGAGMRLLRRAPSAGP